MRTPLAKHVLIGRHEEIEQIDGLIRAARAGRGGALVLGGEAGIGKSTLLDRAAEAASGFRVVRASGAEFEQGMPYAALHHLCRPILEHVPDLPEHLQEALRVAFGTRPGRPDPLRIGLAALELMSAAARVRPLLCLIDDAQWLDPASSRTFVFLARRVPADPVAVLVATRSADELRELPGLTLSGLDDENARRVLAARHPFPLDERVRERLVAEAHGNPLALLELPRAGGFLLPEPASVPARVERGFRARLAELPDDARLLLTVASADPTGDPGLLWPAARLLGLDVSRATADASASGLIEVGTRIRFCHPIARSAVYRSAGAALRRAAHGALADVTDRDAAPDRRAWHRAQASPGPDDDVAAELVRSATRAEARGGVAAAAVFLERAAALSLDAPDRTERTLAAAHAHLDAGTVDRAAHLLAGLDTATLGDHHQARADLLRGRIAFTHGDGSEPIVRAARRLATLDPASARRYFLEAVEMSLVVGRARGVVDEVLAAARAAAPPADAPDLLDALIALSADGYRAARPLLREALAGPARTHQPGLASMIAVELWDLDALGAITDWLVGTGRESGSALSLQLGLGLVAADATVRGDPGRALAAVAEEEAVADAAGLPPLIYNRLHVAAARGRRAEFRALSRNAARVTNLAWMEALLHNGLADYPAALAAARAATSHHDLFLTGVALPELIEAAVRCHEPAVAADALEALSDRVSGPSGTGVAAYSRALLTDDEDDFHEAVSLLAASPLRPYRGRAHLLYGEWLRRQGRRREGITHLRTAQDLLTSSGAEAFADRAAAELRAAGEQPSRRGSPAYEKLTVQELAVARLVAAGATSNEVAVQLFISKRTVDAHLRNIFRKLDLTSRHQLKDHPLDS
ncbi:AAA family ATPase [Cryptosporangium japonicum]|uniref:LuxR family transcriptional regulator n=1 Tax=Cryptosporangium japonicum TaxID=80872 RepID=A0ABP3DBJ8_9ACTN